MVVEPPDWFLIHRKAKCIISFDLFGLKLHMQYKHPSYQNDQMRVYLVLRSKIWSVKYVRNRESAIEERIQKLHC